MSQQSVIAIEEESLPIIGKEPESLSLPERPPIAGSYDDASGPMQMRAQHIALIIYFGTRDWIAAREATTTRRPQKWPLPQTRPKAGH